MGPLLILSRPVSVRATEPSATAAAAPGNRVEAAVESAARWMAAFPTAELRFDAALMLSQIRRVFDLPAIEEAFARARPVADRDHDHPHRVLWTPDQVVPPEVTRGWHVPTAPGERAKPNDVLSEALHCRRNGFRPETLRYACGPMRDDGGYFSTHALWAVTLARDGGCVDPDAASACIAEIQDEIVRAQPASLAPSRSLDVDLYAERLLTLVQSGRRGDDVDGFARRLLEAQRPDGSFGVESSDEPAYFRYHATGVSAWALAEWHGGRGPP